SVCYPPPHGKEYRLMGYSQVRYSEEPTTALGPNLVQDQTTGRFVDRLRTNRTTVDPHLPAVLAHHPQARLVE
ncbi:MAG TPA: hypothetical protein VMX15_00670, partial [Candidatus Heimdallarchaeota archaeon]|nr:hypothetical protein [Candidatus Heimdallarchaeota archaeon]